MKDIKYSKAIVENNKMEIVETTILKQEDILKCPHCIWDPEHYKNNGCDCFDKNAKIMKQWGYKWNNKKQVWI